MIQLEPILNKRGMLLSTMGESTSDREYGQTLRFAVRVVKPRYAYGGRSVIRLATGEELENLFGEVDLHRGKKQMDDGQPYPDTIVYIEPFPGDAGDDGVAVPPSSGAFGVYLYLDPKLFDQIVALSHASRLPWISLDFGVRAPITYGSDKTWDNKEHPRVSIASATVTIPLADQKDEEDDNDRSANFANVSKELLERSSPYCSEKLSKYLQLPSNCGTRAILDTITKMANNHSSDRDEFLSKMEDAIYFVSLMQSTLNPITSDYLHAAFVEDWKKQLPDYFKSADPYSWVWFHRNPALAFLDGKESGNYWPIDRENLAEVCREYISKPWLHCQKIDEILIDAMIYNEALGFGEQIKPALLKTGFVDARRFALNNNPSFNKGQLKKMLMNGFRSLLYIIVSALVGFGTSESHGWWAGLFIGFGFLVLLKINFFIGKTGDSKMEGRIKELLCGMQDISEIMASRYLSPSYLKERLNMTGSKGAVWPVEIFTILEKAIARSPSGEWS